MKCRSMVIVGSGIAGIYAALLAKTKFPNAFISLVEQSEQLGGLLSSTSIDGHWFDYGTHVPRFTGDDSIDTLLFSSIDLSAFRQFQNVNAANVGPFNALYTDSPNPFLGSVKNTLRTQQLSELESQNTNDVHDTKDYSSLEAQLTSKYGQSLTTHFFEPLMKKRFGVSTSNLVPDSHKIIGLQRLILGDGELMRDLKKSPSLDEILAFAYGNSPIVLLKCTSAYPAKFEDANLTTIPYMREKYKCFTGLSDHTLGSTSPVAATALGARVIEKHLCLDGQEGVDSHFSMRPSEFKQMVEMVKNGFEALGGIQKGPSEGEKASRNYRRSIYVVKDIQIGDELTKDNIRVIRPGFGLAPEHYESVLGKKSSVAIKRGTALPAFFIE